MSNRIATLILTSGGCIKLKNPFIMGSGVAGDISDGSTRWFSNDDIERVIEGRS